MFASLCARRSRTIHCSLDLGKVTDIADFKSSMCLDVSECKQSALLLRYCSIFQSSKNRALHHDFADFVNICALVNAINKLIYSDIGRENHSRIGF